MNELTVIAHGDKSLWVHLFSIKGQLNGQLLSPAHCLTVHPGNASKVIKTESLKMC